MENAFTWEWLKTWAVNAPVLLLLAYAAWIWGNRGFVSRRFYKGIGFSKQPASVTAGLLDRRESILLESLTGWSQSKAGPTRAWSGEYRGYPMLQYIATRRRGRRDGRKKSNFQTKYSITIVKTGIDLPTFCGRPKQALEAIDYMFDGKDIEFPQDTEFARLYHVQCDNEEKTRHYFGQPLRELLLQVEGLSLEAVGQVLIIVRLGEYLDLAGNLQVELDAAAELTAYMLKNSQSQPV